MIMAKIKTWLAGVIGLVVLALIFLAAKLRSNPNPNNPNPNNYPYFYGRDLWFDRSAYPGIFYINECKARLNSIFAVFDLFNNAGYDVKAIKSIIVWETGWLSSSSSYNAVYNLNNIVGMTPSGHLKQYSDIYACLTDLDRLFNTSRYTNSYSHRANGLVFLNALSSDGYNSTSAWLSGVIDIYNQL